MEYAFKIHNLDLYYEQTKQVLHTISLNIEKHKVTALIGPSGCGKSTFLRCLNRMNDLIPHCVITGDIAFENENIYDKNFNVIQLRTKVGMVFQKPSPFPMSIYNNVAYGPRCQGIKDKRELDKIVEEALKGAALYDEVKERLHESAFSLSGGQQQRLCIARAIAMKPDVILMDEPTSSLDPIATAKIEELIHQLKEKYTIVIVTHNMQQATRVSDYTVFFLHGHIIESGLTNQIFTKPNHPKTEDYITGRFG